MGEKSAKKVRGHAGLTAGESVADACYGLGKGVLAAADLVKAPGMRHYAMQADRATADPAGSLAAAIDRTGILAVSDHRLLFLPVKTAITRPKAIAAAWPLAQVRGAAYDKPMLTVAFVDGSIGGLHVPANEQPAAFVEAVNRRAAGVDSSPSPPPSPPPPPASPLPPPASPPPPA